MRWADVTSDPNAPAAVAYQDRKLQAATKLTELDRYARGKRVPELGCVDSDFELRTDWWLHGIIGEVASEPVGVDYDQVGVDKVRAAGFDVTFADVTNDMSDVQARGTFDLVVAGEIIEHVYRPPAVLEVALPLLKPSGRLLVTTPNPYAPWWIRAGQRGLTWENVDHDMYGFPAGMAEMGDRAGLRLVAYGSVNITGCTASLRQSGREWLRAKKHRDRLSPVWVSPFDAMTMKMRRGPVLGEEVVHLLEASGG